MTTDRKSFSPKQQPAIKPETGGDGANPDPTGSEGRRTFIVPFVIFTLLALPTLVVLAATKASAGFTIFVELGYFELVVWLLWLDVIIATLSACAYFVRAQGKIGRIGVAASLLVLLTSFVLVMKP